MEQTKSVKLYRMVLITSIVLNLAALAILEDR